MTVYLAQFGKILGASSDDLNGGVRIMVDRKASSPSPTVWMYRARNMLVIVTGRKPTCCKLVISPLTTLRRNPLEFWLLHTQIPMVESVISVLSVMSMPTIGTGVVKISVESNMRSPFPEKPLPGACADAEWEKAESLIVGKTRG